MKNKSSLKTRIRELFPCVVNNITTPVHNPCNEVPLTPKSLKFAFNFPFSGKITYLILVHSKPLSIYLCCTAFFLYEP